MLRRISRSWLSWDCWAEDDDDDDDARIEVDIGAAATR